jgi:hypothetical protein
MSSSQSSHRAPASISTCFRGEARATGSSSSAGKSRRASAWGKASLMLAVAFLAACSTAPTVRSERDRGVDFSAYRTFGFFDVTGTDRAGYETLVTRTLKASTRREMEARGYRYAESGGELLVNFNAQLADRVEITPKPMPVPASGYYGYRSYVTWWDYGVIVDQYKEGTLNIDVVDARQQRLVWEGVAIGRVTDKAYRDREQAIDKAVVEIFKAYPVPPRP